MSEVEASAVQSILARLTQLQWPDVAPNPYNLAGALRAALITLHEGTSGCADSCVARLLTFAHPRPTASWARSNGRQDRLLPTVKLAAFTVTRKRRLRKP